MVLVKRAVDGRKPESKQVSAEGWGHPDAEGLWEAGGGSVPVGLDQSAGRQLVTGERGAPRWSGGF